MKAGAAAHGKVTRAKRAAIQKAQHKQSRRTKRPRHDGNNTSPKLALLQARKRCRHRIFGGVCRRPTDGVIVAFNAASLIWMTLLGG